MNAETITIECEEDGFYITIDGDSVDPDYQAGKYSWRIADPEALYDHVKAAIGPWLRERDEAKSGWLIDHAMALEEEAREAYAASDPKHPDFHSIRADIWDAREGK